MAFNLWKMLGLEKKGAPDTSAITNAVRPFRSLTEIPVGATLNEKILAGLKGAGWGYDPAFLERTTSPLVAQREARWKETELPGISGEMSSRGLGRSTIAQTGINKAFGQKERDINEVLAQAYAADQEQRKADEARYQNLGLSWTGAEAGQQGRYATEDVRRAEIASNAENAYRAEKETERIANMNKTIGLAISGAGAAFGVPTAGLSSMFTSAATPTSTPDLTTLINQIKEALKAGETTPFTKRINPSFA